MKSDLQEIQRMQISSDERGAASESIKSTQNELIKLTRERDEAMRELEAQKKGKKVMEARLAEYLKKNQVLTKKEEIFNKNFYPRLKKTIES